jgi:hypothetical protein
MDTSISLSPDTDPNAGDAKLDPKVLLRALRALRKGEFSTRIATGSMQVCVPHLILAFSFICFLLVLCSGTVGFMSFILCFSPW